MTPEEARRVGDLRLKVLANMQQGLPPHTGIDREELKALLATARKAYTAAQSKSKASGVGNPSVPAPKIDLASLFTNKKTS